MGRRSSVEPIRSAALPYAGVLPHQRAARAVGYLRRSTDRQEQSIPDQQRAVEVFAAEQGLRLLRCYTDDAISGTSTVGRKAFQQMIADASSPSCDFGLVIVYDVKRFGRIDNDEAGYYRHVLRQAGVEVLYASEGFTGDGTDDLLRPVKQWQARQESKDLAKVTIRGLLSKTEAKGGKGETGGWWMGGAPPFGYDLAYQSQSGEHLFTIRYQPDGTKLMLDPRNRSVQRTLGREETVAVSKRDRCRLVVSDRDRVEAVRTIFRLYTEERRGLKAIADRLNRAKVPTARGPSWSERYSGLWAVGTVRAILTNPAYTGDMVWNRRTDARFYRIKGGRAVERPGIHSRRLEPNDEADWHVIQNAHEAIVPRRTFELARKIMQARPESRSQRGINPRTGQPAGTPELRGGWTGPRSRFLLSGLMTCGDCGSRYEGYHQCRRARDANGELRKLPGYACGGYIRHGRSTCTLGFLVQDEAERLVLEAVGGFYRDRFGSMAEDRIERTLRPQIIGDTVKANQERERLAKQVERADTATRKLLDGASLKSDTAREAVEKRLIELAMQRAAAQAQLEAMSRLRIDAHQAQRLLRESAAAVGEAANIAGLELEHAKPLLRRCVDRITVDRAASKLSLKLRALPLVAGAPDAGELETLEVAMPG